MPGSTSGQDAIIRTAWSRISLRGRLLLLVAASTLPLLASGLYLQYLEYRKEVAATGRQIVDLARSMAGQVEQELQKRVTALQVLAQSRRLQLDDPSGFRERAESFARELFPGESVLLVGSDGQLLLSTQTPPGQPLPVRPNFESARQAFATGEPAISNLFYGQLTGRYVVAVDVPVKDSAGTIVAVVSISPPVDTFAEILRQQKLPASWVAAVFDRKGIIIARTRNPEQFVGHEATKAFLDPLLKQAEGVVDSVSREGVPVLSAFSHGKEFGWSVGIGVPKSDLTAPAIDTAVRTLGVSAGLLLTGVALAFVLARQILGPIDRLRRLAVEGAPGPVHLPTGLSETDEVAKALQHAEERRRRSEESFRYLFERSPLPMWVYDPATLRFLAVNDAAIETYGYTRDEFLDMQVSDLGPPEDVARVEQAVRQAPERQHVTDLRHRYKGGRDVDFESFSHAIVFQAEPARVVVMLDVSARKAAEAQLRQAQKMEAIGELTGGLAHDFNNLLSVIIGNLGLLDEGGPGDPDFATFVAESYLAAQRGADLTRSLLAFARRQPLRPTSLDPNTLIAATTTLLRRTLGERIEISLDLGSEIWPVVADASQLEAALINLATNARDAMRKGGRLSIATKNQRLDADYTSRHQELVPGDYVMLQVSDSGIGIAPETLAKVFEPFFTTKARGEGTGLGLSMVFGFIKQSGGHINVYSELGVGTTFRLYLPRDQVASEPAEFDAVAAIPRGRGEKILVVEDDAALRRVVTRQLGQLGYSAIPVENALAALKAFEEEGRIDLVFTDVVMAGKVDGFDLSRIVSERWPTTKVILTSGFPATSNASDVAVLVDTPLLSKPYLKNDLARAVHEALRSGAA
jgi:PAS domain S-box-containing protein